MRMLTMFLLPHLSFWDVVRFCCTLEGLMTAEKRHACHNYTWDKSCGQMTAKGQGETCGNVFNKMHSSANRNTWNANSWPYETSRVLTGMANVLQNNNGNANANANSDVTSSSPVTIARYWQLLHQFAKQHTQSYCAIDTASPPGSGHISENIHPHLGYWNTRQWRYYSGETAHAMNKGKDYFHSSYIDLIISGLLGFKAARGANGELVLTASPLVPTAASPATTAASLATAGQNHKQDPKEQERSSRAVAAAGAPTYFAIDGIRSAAHDIALVWDADGSRYGKGKGLSFLVDGVTVANRLTLGVLNVTLPYAPPKPPQPTPPQPGPSPTPPSPPPAPPSPPAPPTPPVPGWNLLPSHEGTFCCDQAPCNSKAGSIFLYSGILSRDECMAKCAANTRCNYVTEYANGAKYHCFNEQYCNATGKYVDTPSPRLVQTWQKTPSSSLFFAASRDSTLMESMRSLPLAASLPPPQQASDTAADAVSPVYRHGWDTVGSMLFAHGGNKSVLSDNAFAYLAKSYSMVAFANCYGSGKGIGMTQEDATLVSAKRLRSLNPTIKNIFYFKSHLETQVTSCSSANVTWAKNRAHWIMKGDNGTPITNGKAGFFDVRQDAVQDWWVGHLVDLLSNVDSANKPYIDGVYVDGCPGEHTSFKIPPPAGITPAEWQAYSTALYAMVARLQAALNTKGHNQIAICNGLDDNYSLEHVSAPSKYGELAGAMSDHFGVYNFINKTSGAWVPATTADLFFNVVRPSLIANKTVQIKGWAGPLIGPRQWITALHTPNTTSEIQTAMSENWNTALALFLLVAEDNMWWGYSWFWGSEDYIPVGPSHTCPDDFYPQLKCALGAPEGPPQRVNSTSSSLIDDDSDDGSWKYTRKFAHASVHVNLEVREETKVVWNTPECAHFNQ